MTLRFGCATRGEQLTPRELFDSSRAAEERRLDFGAGNRSLAAVARRQRVRAARDEMVGRVRVRTSRILTGTSFLTLTFGYHPDRGALVRDAQLPLSRRPALGIGTSDPMNEALRGIKIR